MSTPQSLRESVARSIREKYVAILAINRPGYGTVSWDTELPSLREAWMVIADESIGIVLDAAIEVCEERSRSARRYSECAREDEADGIAVLISALKGTTP